MPAQGLPIKGPINRSSSVSAGGGNGAAAEGALRLTRTPPAGWTEPGVANRAYVFCTFGSWDGAIPDGIETHVVEIDTTSLVSAERRIYLKATWTPPTMFSLGAGLQPVWDSVQLLASASAGIGSSVLPAQGTPSGTTGYRDFYIIPIGRVRWIVTSGVGAVSLVSDDTGSIRSELKTAFGGITASGGPDIAPVLAMSSDLGFRRAGF